MSTFILVLLLVMAVIIGTLMWLRPSAWDRGLAAQREHAKARGLGVHLRAAPEWLGRPAGSGLVAQYQWLHAMKKEALGRWRWHEGLGNWQPVENPQAWLAPPPWPTPAPAGWLGVDVAPNGVVVYWREDARIASVDTMLEVLGTASA